MNIENLSKPKILAALFNAANPLGLGFLHYRPEHIMDENEANELLKNQTWFDYLEGRIMKIKLTSETTELNTALYNRNNGENAAENAIATIQ